MKLKLKLNMNEHGCFLHFAAIDPVLFCQPGTEFEVLADHPECNLKCM